jgi:hypothetical protein
MSTKTIKSKMGTMTSRDVLKAKKMLEKSKPVVVPAPRTLTPRSAD